METEWTPTRVKLNLDEGPPFLYSNAAISVISNSEAFNTGIDKRDDNRCIVCGFRGLYALEHCYIVPRNQKDRVRSLVNFLICVNKCYPVGVHA